MGQHPAPQGEILLYDNGGQKEFVSVVFKGETFWLTQSGMAELFDCSTDNISLHLKNIYAEEELTPEATTEKISVVRQEGSRQVRRTLDHYNLDAIIAVGYRVNSKKATRFRQWATKTLKEYITKGFVLNDDMLKNGKPFGRDYFDELLERIREIRASERRAYQKIADVFEQCSYDYDKNSNTTKAFYAFVQNKLHFAVTGKTAAELISERATLDSPTMGLTTWKGAPDGKILKSDTLVAKNYLNEKEMSRLNRLVTMFIDYAELMAEDEQLMSMEDLQDAGVRIISIGDNIDFPNDDDWLKIQFQFLINEMPVTDTSKKVKNVIKRRQADGKWICAAPYGYIVNKRQEFEIVPTEADIVRTIFRLYNEEGWGYKKIANHLTDQGIPTPRMAERDRKEAAGEDYNRAVKPAWAIVTVQGILDNDFYIGTLRQGKYTRRKINGKDVLRDVEEQIVIENHHQPIIDYRTFATTRALREKRTTFHYRGVKKYDNVYSGFLVCGDCGAPMFAMSRGDLKSAYTCGTYHRRGRAGCTSHHIRVDKLDELLKSYIQQVMDHSSEMLQRLNEDLAKEQEDVQETEQSADHLAEVLADLQEELKVTKRQRIRDLMKHPDQEGILEQTYDGLEADLQKKIEGISHQIDMLSDKRNTIIQVNRAARTAIEVFGDILHKDKLERRDLELIIRQIKVYEDHLEIQLQADVDSILRSGTLAEPEAVAAIAPAGGYRKF